MTSPNRAWHHRAHVYTSMLRRRGPSAAERKTLPVGTPNSTAFLTPLPVDGRRFLRNGYVQRHYGQCQAGAVLDFENPKPGAVNESDTEAVKVVLERGCKQIKGLCGCWLGEELRFGGGCCCG